MVRHCVAEALRSEHPLLAFDRGAIPCRRHFSEKPSLQRTRRR